LHGEMPAEAPRKGVKRKTRKNFEDGAGKNSLLLSW